VSKSAVSAFIICRNEEKTIGRALASLIWASEVIVVDGESQDGTVAVAKSFGAKVISVGGADGRDFATCRNIALKNCQYGWVFYIDADEECSPELIECMRKFMEGGEEAIASDLLLTPSEHPLGKANTTRVDMYEIRRLEHFKGKLYRHGAGNPSHQWRLFRKTPDVYFKAFAHEYPVFEGEIRRLEKPILHFPLVGLDGIMRKLNRAAELDANDFFSRGIVHGAPYMFFSGLAMFLKSYFRKQGFRDGILGFIFSVIDGSYFFIRQAKLYLKNKEAGRL
jgi:glycosyltransferase involved in cell wall biosynthesis